MVFYTHPSSIGGDAAVEQVRIDSSGNVGIGLTNPTSTLSVLGDVDIISSSARIFGLNLLGLTLASALVFSLLGYARTRRKENSILQQEAKKGSKGIIPH